MDAFASSRSISSRVLHQHQHAQRLWACKGAWVVARGQARAYRRWVLAARLSDPRALGSGAALVGLGCALLAGFGVWFAARQTALAVQGQARGQPYLLDAIERLDRDEPVWGDYDAQHRGRR